MKSSRKDECAPVDLFTHVNNAVSGARRFGGRGSELPRATALRAFHFFCEGQLIREGHGTSALFGPTGALSVVFSMSENVR